MEKRAQPNVTITLAGLIGALVVLAIAAVLLAFPAAGRRSPHLSMDTAMDAETVVRWLDSSRSPGGWELPRGNEAADATGGWLRIRGVPAPGDAPEQNARVHATRQALLRLRQNGYRVFVFDHGAGNARWTGGTRPLRRRAVLPLDLREAFARARALGRAYGDLVDAWEIENEPDLIYVPENPEHYAAYLKACWWGLRLGASEIPTGGGATLGWPARPAPQVVMGPLGLPPGPYFTQLLANDLLAYTDGFNFHYYGYADDFGAVARDFAHAVGAGSTRRDTRVLPVFMSEYGYGSLSRPAAATVSGRVRQWRWFRSVTEQASALGITAPLAFLLPSYFEDGQREFGLGMTTPNLHFQPHDFGLGAAEPWMRAIGTTRPTSSPRTG